MQVAEPSARALDVWSQQIIRLTPFGSFLAPRFLRYRHRLEGVDGDWRERGNERVAQYTNLGAGRYRFDVNVAAPSLGHDWSEAITSVEVEIAPQPWQRKGIQAAIVLALLVLGIMVWNRDAIDDRQGSWAQQSAAPGAGGAAAAQQAAMVREHPMAFLRLPSVWLCFSFFFWSTCALSAIQSFASPALQTMYRLPLSVTAMVVTGYMLCGAAGMLAGGFLVGRVQRLERVISVCLLGSAALLVAVGTGWLPGMAALAVAALAGAGTGLAGPSRDMLIKRAAPPGADAC